VELRRQQRLWTLTVALNAEHGADFGELPSTGLQSELVVQLTRQSCGRFGVFSLESKYCVQPAHCEGGQLSFVAGISRG